MLIHPSAAIGALLALAGMDRLGLPFDRPAPRDPDHYKRIKHRRNKKRMAKASKRRNRR